MTTHPNPKPVRVLMAGPVPGKYSGVSQVAGLILGAEFGDDIQIRYIPTIAKENNYLYKLFLAIQGTFLFLWVLTFSRPDIIHLHVSKGSSIVRKRILQRLAKLARVPVVLHFHGFMTQVKGLEAAPQPDFYRDAPGWLKKIILQMLADAQGLIALSHRYAASLRTITSNPRIFVLYNPVICADFPATIQAEKTPIVLFMADFSKRKGALDLLETLPLVKEQAPSVHYVFCGRDNENAFLKIVQGKGLLDQVTLPGFVSKQEKIEWFQKAMIFVLPSYQEGVPMSVLEAMAAGLPIITTPVGGIPDVVSDPGNALFIEPGDRTRLSQHILFLLENKTIGAEMGQRNRSRVIQEYDISIYMEALSNIYFGLVEEDPSECKYA